MRLNNINDYRQDRNWIQVDSNEINVKMVTIDE